jgi:hypothetical protein
LRGRKRGFRTATTAFTYQVKLTDTGNPANGRYTIFSGVNIATQVTMSGTTMSVKVFLRKCHSCKQRYRIDS